MKIEIIKPIYQGGKMYFEEGDIIEVKNYHDKIFYKKNETTIFIPRSHYKEVSN